MTMDDDHILPPLDPRVPPEAKPQAGPIAKQIELSMDPAQAAIAGMMNPDRDRGQHLKIAAAQLTAAQLTNANARIQMPLYELPLYTLFIYDGRLMTRIEGSQDPIRGGVPVGVIAALGRRGVTALVEFQLLDPGEHTVEGFVPLDIMLRWDAGLWRSVK